MVELNFDRRRPEAILDLTRVPELRDWGHGRRAAAHRRGCFLHARDRGARRPAARAGARLPHGRVAPDPQPRHDRRQPRSRLAGGRRAPTAARRRAPRSSSRRRAGCGASRCASSSRGPKRRACSRDDELIAAVRVAPAARAAAVLEDRHAQRDGHRGVLVRALDSTRPPAASAPGIGSAGPTPLVAGRGRGVPGGRARRRPDAWEGEQPLGEPALERFGELVASAARPIDDVRSSAAYRAHALGVLARRTLAWAMSGEA